MVTCKICGYKTGESLQSHLKSKHNIKNAENKELYPSSEIYSESYRNKLVKSNAERDPSYKKKISENTKKLYKDEEWVKYHNNKLKEGQNSERAKLNHKAGANRYYKNRTDKEKKEHSLRAINSWKNDKIRSNREKALKEGHNKKESKENHSKATKLYLSDPVNLKNRKELLKETWSKPGNREKLKELSKKGLLAANSIEGRKNFYEAQKNPLLRKKRSEIAKKNILNMLSSGLKRSKLNFFLEEKMRQADLCPEPEYIIGPYAVDFCFPKERIVIEADGDWWHANPSFLKRRKITSLHPIQKNMVRLDKAKNTYLINRGWILIRFWEEDIYKHSDRCIKKIREVINECHG